MLVHGGCLQGLFLHVWFEEALHLSNLESLQAYGMDLKSAMILFQVIGYTLSKILGVNHLRDTPDHRARRILLLTSIAWLALLGFAALPLPHGVWLLFLNGLMLGMVFGLVLGSEPTTPPSCHDR